MKEVKFLAWDGEKIVTVKSINSYHNIGYDINEDSEGNVTEIKHGHLMLYTGLKDKNGQEIYDGYLIKFDVYDGYSSERVTDSVYYNAKEARFRLAIRREYDVWRFGEDIEVVGNIYENPELLKDSHESQ